MSSIRINNNLNYQKLLITAGMVALTVVYSLQVDGFKIVTKNLAKLKLGVL